jgi:hypothetical protein
MADRNPPANRNVRYDERTVTIAARERAESQRRAREAARLAAEAAAKQKNKYLGNNRQQVCLLSQSFLKVCFTYMCTLQGY